MRWGAKKKNTKATPSEVSTNLRCTISLIQMRAETAPKYTSDRSRNNVPKEPSYRTELR